MPRISRPVLTVLPGGKREDEPEVSPASQGCPHCHEHEVAHEEAERRKAARRDPEPVDEQARQRKARARSARLLD
jgi:hypothetical protein